MANDARPLETQLVAVADDLARYRQELSEIRDELAAIEAVDFDAAVIDRVGDRLDALVEQVSPLEIQLSAVSRQQVQIEAAPPLGVDLDAFGRTERTARDLAAQLPGLAARLGAFVDLRDKLQASAQVTTRFESMEALQGDLSRCAEADAVLQMALDALAEPVAAHQAALRALEACVEEVVEARARHDESFTALRNRLRAFTQAEREDGGGAAESALADMQSQFAQFEIVRDAQLHALQALGFDGLVDRIEAFEEARAAQIPDFRTYRLDALKTQVGEAAEMIAAHREALLGIDLGALEHTLDRLDQAWSRRAKHRDQLALDVIERQLAAVAGLRSRQEALLGELGLGDLRDRLTRTMERLAALDRTLAEIDLRDARTAPRDAQH